MKNEQSTLTEKQAVDGLQPDIDVNNEGENEIIDVPIVNKKEFVVTGLMSMLLGKTNHGVKEFMKQLDNKKEFLVHRQIQSMHFNGSFLSIKGEAYFSDYPEKDVHKITKKLILTSRDEEIETVEIALKNEQSTTAIESKYPYAAYSGEVDFQKLSEGLPLAVGQYDMMLEISQYIAGEWQKQKVTLGTYDKVKTNFVHSTTMQSYSSRSNKKFKLTISYNVISEGVRVVSKKLAEVDPLDMVTGNQGPTDNRIVRGLKNRFFRLAYKMHSLLPVKNKNISFLSDSRNDISGNFEYIYEEIKKRQSDFKLAFYLKGSIKQDKSFTELNTLAKAIATSKYIMVDDFYPLIYPLKIRKNSELIQVWHAVGAFKTFGYSRVGMPGGPKLTSKNHRNYTKVLVSSKNIVNKYAEGFGIAESAVIPIGAPRTDLFFDEVRKKEIVDRLHEELPFINGKKVILFAPTFRGNGQQTAYYPFGMINFKEIYEALKNEYVFLLKIHPFVQNKPEIPYEYDNFFYDVSEYREINDLLLISDQLVTDYSSVCFEYALLNKPMVFFSPDLGEYMSDRDFYYDYFDFIPGSYASNTTMLIEKLKKESVDTKRLETFKDYFFDDLDGKVSERFVDILMTDGFADVDEEVEVEQIWGSVDNKNNKKGV